MRMRPRRLVLAVLALAAAVPATAAEQGKIAVEFNDLQPAESGCRAVFVLNNGLAQPLGKLALRVVAFDKDEHATLFLSLDVGALPVGKTRVLRFDLGDGVACDSIGKLVLDDVTACEGGNLDPASCLAAIALSSRAPALFVF
ncbi:MAG TPA: hypothetical protein VHA70_13695 [Bauldia sp.]|nr:hypothetical protein [Bauldia sp.]